MKPSQRFCSKQQGMTAKEINLDFSLSYLTYVWIESHFPLSYPRHKLLTPNPDNATMLLLFVDFTDEQHNT